MYCNLSGIDLYAAELLLLLVIVIVDYCCCCSKVSTGTYTTNSYADTVL